jgi:hypothetical protein
MFVATLIGLLDAPAAAHRGPPFPVLVDHRLSHFPFVMSVWADPDIGDARFFIILEPADNSHTHEPAPAVSFWVEPISGRQPRTPYAATREVFRDRDHIQFAAHPYFDQRDQWRVGVELARREGPAEEVVLQIESTPPGLGPWDLALYVLPFLLFGGLWAKALVQRHRARVRDWPSHWAQEKAE